MAIDRAISCCGTLGEGPGVPGADVNFFLLGSDDEKQVSGTVETIMYEWIIDFDDLHASILELRARLAGIISSSDDGSVTYRVRVGGTIATVDGTIFMDTGPTPAPFPPGGIMSMLDLGPFARPVGAQPVKVTAFQATPGETVFLRAVEVLLAEA